MLETVTTMSLHTMSVIRYERGEVVNVEAGAVPGQLASLPPSRPFSPSDSGYLGGQLMQDDYIECAELSGKTIRRLRIYKTAAEGVDIEIELSDGIRFTCSMSNRPTLKASLYRCGTGSPETIREYEV